MWDRKIIRKRFPEGLLFAPVNLLPLLPDSSPPLVARCLGDVFAIDNESDQIAAKTSPS